MGVKWCLILFFNLHLCDLLVRVNILSHIYMRTQILECLGIDHVHVSIVFPVYY